MRKLLSVIIVALLLVSAVTSFAATKTDLESVSLDKLSKAEKTILTITLKTAIAQASEGKPVSGSIPSLDIQFSDYSLDQLVAFQERVTGKATNTLGDKAEGKHQDVINAVLLSAKEHFDKDHPIEVELYGENLLIKVSGKNNLSAKLIKAGMLMSVYDVMNENRKAPVDFDFLISFPLVDKFGNSQQSVVMKVTFKSESMAKINWERFLHIDVEEAADRYWEHPAFSK